MKKKVWLLSIVLVSGMINAFGKPDTSNKWYLFYRPSLFSLPVRVPCVLKNGRLVLRDKEWYGTYNQDDRTVCIQQCQQWDDQGGNYSQDIYVRGEPLRDTLTKIILFTTGITAATVAAVTLINKIYHKKICAKKAMRIACGGSLAALAAYYATFGPYIMF